MAPRTLRAERSHKGALSPSKTKEAPRRQSGIPRLEGLRLPAEQNGNPLSRDVAAERLRQADGPPAPRGGDRRAPARVSLSAAAADFPLLQNGH